VDGLRSFDRAYRRLARGYRATFGVAPFWEPALDAGGRAVLRLLESTTVMAVPPDDCWGFGTRLQFLLGWYEAETVALCRTLVRPGMTVLDIGAHCGYYTRLFSNLVGPDGKVYAFEADPATYDYLARNIRLSRHQNVVIVPKAVADRRGTVEFFVMTGTGKHSLYDTSRALGSFTVKERISVEATTIDDFLAEHGNPDIDFLKMDIEGAEPRALDGMTATLARLEDLSMVVELHPGTLHSGGVRPGELVKRLEVLGFRIDAIHWGGRLKPVQDLDLADGQTQVNLVCRKAHGRPFGA
jgi:FkbM family methyltransferase